MHIQVDRARRVRDINCSDGICASLGREMYSEQVCAQHAGQQRLASIADLSGDGVVYFKISCPATSLLSHFIFVYIPLCV